MITTPFWHVLLRTISDHNWCGYFVHEPTPRDICTILEQMPHCPRVLLDLAEHIPDDYIKQAKSNEYTIKADLTEIGTIGILKKEAYQLHGEQHAD